MKRIKQCQKGISRRDFLKMAGMSSAGLALGTGFSASGASIMAERERKRPAEQTQIPGNSIPQFTDPLPVLSAANGTMQTVLPEVLGGTDNIVIDMVEEQTKILPAGFKPANGKKYNGTWVFRYVAKSGKGVIGKASSDTYIGPVIVAARGKPTEVKYINSLTAYNIHWRDWIDQSLHWANPLGAAMMQDNPNPPPDMIGNSAKYMGPVPAVPHLHGGEVPAVIDGGPEAWWTSDGRYRGEAFYSMNKHNGDDNKGDHDEEGEDRRQNYAIYRYPNSQEAAPLWFHDHLLGATRINATFAGLAGAYVIIDPAVTLPAGLHPVGLQNINGSNLRFTIPLVIQDRMFDTDGQLFFPTAGVSPEHPTWVPEFVGDTIVVNGKVWPYLNVDRQRYHFYLINGSNSVPYEMWLEKSLDAHDGPSMWVIANDGGYLDTPVEINPSVGKMLLMMPGERYEIIIDFAGVAAGTNLILRNNGETVDGFPDPATTGRIMQFRVSANAPIDTSYNPAGTIPLRSGAITMKRLVNPAAGTLATGVTPAKTRELTLNEVESSTTEPLEALLNNSKWNGKRPNGTPIPGSTLVNGNWLAELPKEGETEVWEIVNLTADRHPIHLHGVQFQILNRQFFTGTPDTGGGFWDAYQAAFPGGAYLPENGPPLGYSPSLASGGKCGGNPDIVPFLDGPPIPPELYEAGWKDTAIMPSGMVTRIVVRFAPQDKAVDGSNMYFPFDPSSLSSNGQPGYYVWHCHITDHEDNEMMRPYQFQTNPAAVRTYIQGKHF